MTATSLFPSEQHLGLMTDLYELAMAAGYQVHGLAERRATFELSVRRLPAARNYLVAAGLAQAVHFLQRFSFSPEQVKHLRQHPAFAAVPASFFEKLAGLRFEGDLWALPEGTIFFPPEPMLRVTAPLWVAQLVETYLISTVTMQTMIASKASRVVTAAAGRQVIDFGARRAHGPQAGMLAARAAFVGGVDGTSQVEAARRLGIPSMGTQAHAWIMAFADETEAFRKFGETFPDACTLLVDTYDTLAGVKHALASGAKMQAIRLDSGDLAALSKEARKLLDAAGRPNVKIIASGDLNEQRIADLVAAGAPIDSFGVGTELATSRDEPTLSAVFKLVELETEYGMTGRVKGGGEKKTYPYAKQVFRFNSPDGARFEFDTIVRETELLEGDPLLVQVLKKGELMEPLPDLAASRRRCAEQRKKLPPGLQSLAPAAAAYRVELSKHLQREAERLANAATAGQPA